MSLDILLPMLPVYTVLDGPAEQVPSNKRFGRIRIQPGNGFAQNSSSSSHAPRGTSGRPSPTMKQAFRCRGSYQLPVDPRSEGLSPRREADAGRGPSHRRLAEAAPYRPSATSPSGGEARARAFRIIVFRYFFVDKQYTLCYAQGNERREALCRTGSKAGACCSLRSL